jgi:Nif-specific regulatory protein
VELAEGGTLFLDEIGDLPPDIQGKLLRFLQERVFERVGGRTALRANVRVVCATHQDLEKAVRDHRFREDLYYRIRVVEIELPPLRARGPDEVEQLARHFADMYSQRYGRPQPTFEAEALARMRAHRWPGNVRELEHWVESAIVLAPDGYVRVAHLPEDRGQEALPGGEDADVALPLGLPLDEATRRYVEATVSACGGNKAEAARRLRVGRNTIGRTLKS